LTLPPRRRKKYVRRVSPDTTPQTNTPDAPQKAVRPSLSDTPDEPPNGLLDVLDWLIRLTARLIVLGLGFAVLRVGWVLYSGSNETYRGLTAIQKLAEHWPVFALLLIPLFYLPIRRLIYRAKAFGDNPVPPEQPTGTGNTTPPGKGTQIDAGKLP
jgi:hypothetical protein